MFSTPVDMGISPEYYPPRSQEYTTSMAYDHSTPLYADAPYNMYHAKSPSLYPDDSNLSVDSHSASSSNAGSPLSNPGNLASWGVPLGPVVSPGIVDQGEYFHGNEYSFTPLDGYNPNFEFPVPKGPGFVGEFEQIPRSHLSPSQSLSAPSCSSSSTSCTTTPKAGLVLDARLPTSSAIHSTVSTSSSSMVSTPVLSSPATSASSRFPSPPLPARGKQYVDRRPQNSRIVSSFFTQSSGHFVPPLDSSCWFPLSDLELIYQKRTADSSLTNRPFLDPPRSSIDGYAQLRANVPCSQLRISRLTCSFRIPSAPNWQHVAFPTKQQLPGILALPGTS